MTTQSFDAPGVERDRLARDVRRRRTFAIISHPDAGKTTLTEKLLLYGGAIELAGAEAVELITLAGTTFQRAHYRDGRQTPVSDAWSLDDLVKLAGPGASPDGCRAAVRQLERLGVLRQSEPDRWARGPWPGRQGDWYS